MLRLILLGFMTSTESAVAQRRDDLKGREKREVVLVLAQGPFCVFQRPSGGLACRGTVGGACLRPWHREMKPGHTRSNQALDLNYRPVPGAWGQG